MGLIVKYQLEFPETGLKVSNDLWKGEFIIDADISVEMFRRASGSKFTIKMYDLPNEKGEDLHKKLKDGLHIKIKLGYFDGPFELVMEGVVNKIHSLVQNNKLITSISGFEIGTNALRKIKFDDFKDYKEEDLSLSELINKLFEKEKEGIVQTPEVPDDFKTKKLTNKTIQGENLLEILDELAEIGDAELLVCDKKVRIGKPVLDNNYQPPVFQQDTNLAVFQPFSKKIPDEAGRNLLKPLETSEVQGFEFTITGDPELRPAHKVTAEVKGYEKLSAVDFRVHSLVHNFTTSGGYICKGAAVVVCTGKNCYRKEKALSGPSSEMIARSLVKKIKSENQRRPAIEIGKIKKYLPGKQLCSTYYGQRFEKTETQPSIRTEIDTDELQIYPNKPVVSPFAWHKCGLIVPIYPGMKAILNHNLNLQDDALITGFTWSEDPAIEPPKNNEGDWWLCLPVDFDKSNPPEDSTKAVNDLIANNGKRVIELKGLKITIGNDKLSDVGKRPSEGADDEFLIEHKSGTRFKIASDGAITIESENILIKSDITIEGNLEIK